MPPPAQAGKGQAAHCTQGQQGCGGYARLCRLAAPIGVLQVCVQEQRALAAAAGCAEVPRAERGHKGASAMSPQEGGQHQHGAQDNAMLEG
eukprot:CAMPEP_0168374640 /NCGR_PEP_ID=MMETSP0228-20121227/9404_1 /TAXON_ID=133427 /ORGANISM="Protoceratium reticulatum, Strain CCCM 535 (=CCMP 1889)" /LENGTH=90 /DNA_ID=CAMNT_0008387591 /DNA_START=291 /DNA_END=560 /DNA_ORIENTATION=+